MEELIAFVNSVASKQFCIRGSYVATFVFWYYNFCKAKLNIMIIVLPYLW